MLFNPLFNLTSSKQKIQIALGIVMNVWSASRQAIARTALILAHSNKEILHFGVFFLYAHKNDDDDDEIPRRNSKLRGPTPWSVCV